MMALQGSPPPPPSPFGVAGSPHRLVNGQHDHHFPPPIFGAAHRPMLPPSPQQFPRYQPAPPASMPTPGSVYDMKAPPAPPPPLLNPHKRPGSSMSISSMLGGDTDHANHSRPPFHDAPAQRPGPNAAAATPAMSVNAIMSPPQAQPQAQPARGGVPDFLYRRSHTPDRLESLFNGNRQRSASSGTSMPAQRSLYESSDHYARPPTSHYHATPPWPVHAPSTTDEQDDRTRRTSLSAILQRPSSQPQVSAPPPPQPSRQFDPLPPHRPNWYADPPSRTHDPLYTNGLSGSYDTKPPNYRDLPRAGHNAHPSPSLPPPHPSSPDSRRSNHTLSSRGLAGLLNASASAQLDPTTAPAHSMTRQDSSQSQSDRSVPGDRNRFRHFSPYTTGTANHHHSNGPLEELSRKASDEISHKTIAGLGFENRRGRFSPVPQAVQGAQAQTPIPDGGNKSDHGKVFSGIGGGIGISTTPIPASSSPFKKDEALARTSDSLKMGRTASTTGKRSRKVHDEDEFDGKKSTAGAKGNKRTKYQNSYKADLEEMAARESAFPRRATPLAGISGVRATSGTGSNVTPSSTRYDTAPIFRPRKTVKVATVVSQTLRKPRRHLGTFSYEPEIPVPVTMADAGLEQALRVEPRLLPSFSDVDDINCIYTIRVSKSWLRDRDRRIICSSRNLWGTGIYTDDSDPVAAAMHMGWIKPAFHDVDQHLLRKLTQDQNPKVEISKDLKPPSHPVDLSKGQDAKITCVVMPALERYDDTARFGVQSRAWPDSPEGAVHDGVSFSILKVEAVDIGREERRMGRTGESKRARLRAQLVQRERSARLEKERVAKATKMLKEDARRQQQGLEKRKLPSALPPSPLTNQVTMADVQTHPTAIESEEWHQQLATAAA